MGHSSDASIYNAIRDGLFPVGVQIGQRARGWPDYEVTAINTARIAGKICFKLYHLLRRWGVSDRIPGNKTGNKSNLKNLKPFIYAGFKASFN
jgi:prophage regulatory protein